MVSPWNTPLNRRRAESLAFRTERTKKPGQSRAPLCCSQNWYAYCGANSWVQGAMRFVTVSLWKVACSRNWNQPPCPLDVCATLLLSFVAKSSHEL